MEMTESLSANQSLISVAVGKQASKCKLIGQSNSMCHPRKKHMHLTLHVNVLSQSANYFLQGAETRQLVKAKDDWEV